MATTTSPIIKSVQGGSFLIVNRTPDEVFTPEDFSEEQRQIAETAFQFASNEVLPQAAKIEAKDFEVTRGLLKKAGDLGLMAIDIPEEYGGLAMDKTTSAIVADRLSIYASFSVAFSAHVGIGTLPIVWYGTEEQKKKYLPKLASGEWIGAYALSEATSGSDAMNLHTRGELTPDGKSYVLNGEKMWITNAGFADLFTVFAKVDGDKFSAFLIERGTPGLSIGAEEHKLGIRGSSTCPLILSDCKIPVENLLGEVGKGQYIAFNILNIGRFKLGAACLGGARNSLTSGIRYAKERKAFGKAIADFGMIQEKIAESAIGVFAGESMAYRTVGMIDAALATLEGDVAHSAREIQKHIEEFAVECSILKVWGSEMLDMVVDHTLQIYAGYGFVEEYPAERPYRDSRINRIFEGTNEINRLIITGWLMKKAMKGELALMPAIGKLMEEVMAPPSFDEPEDFSDPLANEVALLASAKKIALFAAGAASQKYMAALADEQEVMGELADLLIQVYSFESALLRAQKLAAAKSASASLAQVMVKVHADRCFTSVEIAARRVLAAVAEGDMLRTQMAIFRRLVKRMPVNTIELNRTIAAAMIQAGRYSI
jgi:alkylation response protein AidB-like acyl-CoA dehydrogenase